MAPYSEQLQKLAADQTLREAMTGFALGPGAGTGIAPQHRPGWPNVFLMCHMAFRTYISLSHSILRLTWLARSRTRCCHPCTYLELAMHAIIVTMIYDHLHYRSSVLCMHHLLHGRCFAGPDEL